MSRPRKGKVISVTNHLNLEPLDLYTRPAKNKQIRKLLARKCVILTKIKEVQGKYAILDGNLVRLNGNSDLLAGK